MIESLFSSKRTFSYRVRCANMSVLFNFMGCALAEQTLQYFLSYKFSIQSKIHAFEYGGWSNAVQFCLEN